MQIVDLCVPSVNCGVNLNVNLARVLIVRLTVLMELFDPFPETDPADAEDFGSFGAVAVHL